MKLKSFYYSDDDVSMEFLRAASRFGQLPSLGT